MPLREVRGGRANRSIATPAAGAISCNDEEINAQACASRRDAARARDARARSCRWRRATSPVNGHRKSRRRLRERSALGVGKRGHCLPVHEVKARRRGPDVGCHRPERKTVAATTRLPVREKFVGGLHRRPLRVRNARASVATHNRRHQLASPRPLRIEPSNSRSCCALAERLSGRRANAIFA